MQSRLTLFLSACTLLLLLTNRENKCYVQSVPISETYDLPAGTEFKNGVPKSIDHDVQELEKLKIPDKVEESVSILKSRESVYTNNNGKEKAIDKIQQQVNKNGELLAKLEQKVMSKNDRENNGRPETNVNLSIDIPSKGIHKQTSYTSNEEPKKQNYKRFDKKNYASSYQSPDFDGDASPQDMAEYIFFTKDDKSVTQAIEKLIQEGRLDREAALAYLALIDKELYRLNVRYSDTPLDVSKDFDSPIKYHKSYDSPEFNDILDDTSAELKEIQQILREKFDKRNKVLDEEDDETPHDDHAKMRLTDSQYQQLLESLSSIDYTYAQTMMDEIIYQLAKVMFNQALYIGGTEAQESLQKFTDFLEAEASQGRISRALEKKILELLILSLSDTLNEHPELLAAAKQGFSKYLDTYPNSKLDSVRKANELNEHKTNKVLQKKNYATSVKQSIKTSGLEDEDNVKI
ncbi:uncharacterized protein LOC126905349 isoform X3 [Daktulosphaira vitifoliae]|uniref:uncharacterized protein LOC126905349 isoform X3 n=1 Tax=Daktulosphaira vitifoliae TaxID=58002 RepID=UPI0021AA7908|nr:uncharacterized protein LOC126905349 isoform X3 [Daktulosphaira vitifoliae]